MDMTDSALASLLIGDAIILALILAFGLVAREIAVALMDRHIPFAWAVDFVRQAAHACGDAFARARRKLCATRRAILAWPDLRHSLVGATMSLTVVGAVAWATGPTTYYVSASAANGYALGSDANACTSKAAPCLTIAAAALLATSGADTIVVNPGSTYVENSGGNGYLNLNYPVTLTGDTSLCGTLAGGGSKPMIQATASSRIVNAGQTGALTIGCAILDAQSGASRQGVSPQSANTTITLQQIDWKNFVASEIGGVSASNMVFTLDRNTCGADSTGNGFFGFAGDTTHNPSVVIYGGNYGCGGTIGIYMPGTNMPAFRALRDVNGALPIFAGGSSYCAYFSGGTYGVLEIHAALGGACSTGIGVVNSTVSTSMTMSEITASAQPGGQLQIWNVYASSVAINSCNLTQSGATHPSISVYSENTTGFSMSGCTLNGMVGGSVPMAYVATSGSPQIIGNTFTSPVGGNTQMFKGGSDGVFYDASNTATTGEFAQGLGDVSADLYVDSPWTTNGITSSGRAPYMAYVDADLKKTGSPTGNISFSLYADSGGNPTGSALATSSTVSAATLSTSVQQVHFTLATPVYLSPNTKYHIVWTYGGTIDGANYPQLDANTVTTTAVASLQKSANGSSWTADSSHYLRAIVATGFYTSKPVYAFNKCLYADTTNAAERECINGGPVLSMLAFGNWCMNCGYVVLAKNALSTSASPTIMFANTSVATVGTNTGTYCKASPWCFQYNNTTWLGAGVGGGGAGVTYGPDSIGAINPIGSPNGASRNNLIINLSSSATCFNVLSGSTGFSADNDDCYSPNKTTIDAASGNNWAAWQGNGFDVHGLTLSPGLPASPQAAAQLAIALGSPLARAGAAVTGAANDNAGHVFLSPRPIGAFQPLASSAPLLRRRR